MGCFSKIWWFSSARDKLISKIHDEINIVDFETTARDLRDLIKFHQTDRQIIEPLKTAFENLIKKSRGKTEDLAREVMGSLALKNPLRNEITTFLAHIAPEAPNNLHNLFNYD